MAMLAPRQTATFWRRRKYPRGYMLRKIAWPLATLLGLASAIVFAPNVMLAALDERALLADAHAALDSGDPDGARAEVTKALEKEPGSAEAYLMLARVDIARRDGEGAAEALDRAHALGMAGERLHAHLGAARLIGGDLDGAEEALNAKIVEEDLGLANHLLARIAEERGEPERAGPIYRLALRFSPDDALLWADYADYLDRTGDGAAAGKALDKALELGPGNPRVLEMAGRIAERRQGPAAAIDYYRRGLARSPDDLSLLDRLARALGATGHYREMLDMARHMLSVDPENGQAFYLLGWIAERGDKPKLAAALLGRAQDDSREQPAFMLLSGVVDYRLGRFGDAAEQFRTLLDRRSDNPAVRRLLAASLLKSGDPLAALDVIGPLAETGDAAAMRIADEARAAAGRR